MKRAAGRLQVFFEEPFWIGVFERSQNGKLSVCKVTFGVEPKDYEVLDFILHNYDQLRFSPCVNSEEKQRERINPKRMQREVKNQINSVGIGTKSQQALKLQQEQGIMQRKIRTKEQMEELKEYQYERKLQKKKEKHRGR